MTVPTDMFCPLSRNKKKQRRKTYTSTLALGRAGLRGWVEWLAEVMAHFMESSGFLGNPISPT